MHSRLIIGEYSYINFLPSVDAVYAAAHAIHNMIVNECGTKPFHFCEALRPAPLGRQLLKFLKNISFIGKLTFFFYVNKYCFIIELYLTNHNELNYKYSCNE